MVQWDRFEWLKLLAFRPNARLWICWLPPALNEVIYSHSPHTFCHHHFSGFSLFPEHQDDSKWQWLSYSHYTGNRSCIFQWIPSEGPSQGVARTQEKRGSWEGRAPSDHAEDRLLHQIPPTGHNYWTVSQVLGMQIGPKGDPVTLCLTSSPYEIQINSNQRQFTSLLQRLLKMPREKDCLSAQQNSKLLSPGCLCSRHSIAPKTSA